MSIIVRNPLRAGLALFAAAMSCVSAAAAQPGPVIGGGVFWEGYQFGTADVANVNRLSLLTVPVNLSVPLDPRVSFQLRAAFAHAQLSRADGSDAVVSGPTDTELRLGLNLGSPRRSMATLSAVALLPTGTSRHTIDEAEVAGVIAADLLPFRISHWGSGGGFGASAGAIRPIGDGSIGASASYLLAREFEPIELDGAAPFLYRPGNQLQLRAAVDQNVGASGKLTASFTFLRHADDEHAGANLYRPGTRFYGMSSYAFAAGASTTALLYVGGLHRNQGTPLAGQVVAAPAQNLVLAGAGLRMPVGQGVIAPSVDLRLHRSEDGLGQGYLVGLGASLDSAMIGTVFTQTLRVRAGNLVMREGLETRLLGVELGLSARLGRR